MQCVSGMPPSGGPVCLFVHRGPVVDREDARKITGVEHEDARQVADDIANTRQCDISLKLWKKFEMLFAHLKCNHGLGRHRLRGAFGANDEFLFGVTA